MFTLRYTNSCAAAALLFAVLVGAIAGCEPEAGQAAPKKPVLSAPEESFNRIVERIKRRIEHGPGQSFSSAGLDPSLGEMSHFTSVEKVHGELIKPEEEGGTYTAKIIIERDLFFMHTREGSADDAPEEKAKPESNSLPSLVDDLPDEFPLGEDSLLPDDLTLPTDVTADAPPAEPATGAVRAPTPSKKLHDVKRYELAYENGRWVRKTEVEEESMKLIFDYALADQ